MDTTVVVHHGDYLYVAAGSDGADRPLSHLHRFSLLTFDWEDLSNPEQTYDPVILAGGGLHNDFLYIFFGWNTEEQKDVNSVFRVDLASSDFAWESVSLATEELARDSFAYSLVNDTFYMFAGYTAEVHDPEEKLKNEIIMLNLTEIPLKHTQIEGCKSPPPRYAHSLNLLYDRLILFGGATDKRLLNDIWEFDPEKKQWKEIPLTGQFPVPRSNHGASADGDTLVIWGGLTAIGFTCDLRKFSYTSGVWELVPSASSVPVPRSDPCIVLSTPYLFIFGGYNELGLSNELWVFHTGNRTYELLSSGDCSGPPPGFRYSCSVEKDEDGNRYVYIMMGTGKADETFNKIYYYDYSERKWNEAMALLPNQTRNSAYVEKINRTVVVAGGEQWGVHLFKDIFLIDLDTKTTVEFKNALQEFFLTGAGVYFKNDMYLHGGGHPLSTVSRPHSPSSKFLKYDLFDLTETFRTCSLGSINNDITDTCELCDAGTYLEDYKKKQCEQCKQGFANSRRGANSELQCFPCPEGSYSEEPGSKYCLDCPAAASCSIGSEKISYDSSLFDEVAAQPDFYAYKTEEVERTSFFIGLVVAGLLVVLTAACLFTPRLRRVLKGIDIYGRIVLSKDKNKVTREKSMRGGVCQMFCVLISVLLLSKTMLAFLWNNMHETKTLVPFVVMKDSEAVWANFEDGADHEFTSESVTLQLILDNYFGDCETGTNTCSDKITIEPVEDMTLTCESDGNTCKITLCYGRFTVPGSVQWKFTISGNRDYCSGVQAILMMASSVLEDTQIRLTASGDDLNDIEYYETSQAMSAASQSIFADTGKVFTGTPPTTIYFSAIPSIYDDRTVPNSGRSGYHVVVNKPPTAGTQVATNDLQFEDSLQIVVEVIQSENGFMTIRENKEQWYLMIFAIIGSLIGAYEIVRVLKHLSDKGARSFEKWQDSNKEAELIKFNDTKLRNVMQDASRLF